MDGRRFPIRIEDRWRLLLRIAFGVTIERAWAAIEDGRLVARFGWYSLDVPLEDIVSWRIEGPWRWITAIGVRSSPPPFSQEVSFAGSARGGVRIELRERMKWTILDVPAFYLGVDDLEGLAAELTAVGIDGEDARAEAARH